jgi:hypothetical protein
VHSWCSPSKGVTKENPFFARRDEVSEPSNGGSVVITNEWDTADAHLRINHAADSRRGVGWGQIETVGSRDTACIDQTEIWQHRVANSRQRNVIGAAEQQATRRGVRTEGANEWKALGEAGCDLQGTLPSCCYSSLMSRLISQSSAVVLEQTCRGCCQLEAVHISCHLKRTTFQMVRTRVGVYVLTAGAHAEWRVWRCSACWLSRGLCRMPRLEMFCLLIFTWPM